MIEYDTTRESMMVHDKTRKSIIEYVRIRQNMLKHDRMQTLIFENTASHYTKEVVMLD